MQNLHPSPPPSETEFDPGTVPIGPPAPPELDGVVPVDAGSALYVEAWDSHLRQSGAREERRQRLHTLRVRREIVETGILALVIFLGVRSIVQNFRVEGLSMDPTYATGQYLLVNKALYTRLDLERLSGWVPFWESNAKARYLFRGPRRGDVIVFVPPIADQGNRDFIKRVIGMPGDRIVVKDGRISINGRLLTEPYLPGTPTYCGGQFCDVTLGADEYYMMGDNRGNSSDSRLWGPVAGSSVVGKAWLIYLPFSDFGGAPNGGEKLADAADPAGG